LAADADRGRTAVPSSVVLSGAAARRQVDRGRLALFAVRYGLFLALGLWMVVMTIASEHFLSWLNFLNVFRQAAPVVVVAVGMTLVMATAGIDLSVGSLVGLVNGAFVRLGLPAFVVTLAALTYLRGIAFVASDGYAVPIADETFLWFGRGELGGIHVPIVLAVVVALAGYVILNKTRFGLYALAVGGREEAARAMGIDVGRIKLAAYAGVGLLAALGGIIATARLGNGSPNAGIMFELDVISATVLGGTSLFGGYATVGGSVAGALFINFVRNGLNLLGVNPFWVQVVTGVILLLAVLVNTVVNRRVAEWARLAGAEPEPGGPEDEE
jgi:ribose transport system permease protein